MDFMRCIHVDCDFYVAEWWKELRRKKDFVYETLEIGKKPKGCF